MNNRLKPALRQLMNTDLAPLWDMMSRNWIVKLICLVLAFVVWQVIRENTSKEVVVSDIPVVIRTGNGHAVLDQSTDVVSVRFRGSRDDIQFLSRDQVAIEIDLTKRTESLRHDMKLSPRYVRAPSRAHAVDFSPSDVVVTLDREVERVLPVKAAFSGQLPESIQLGNAVCDPASIRIRGAEQKLLELEEIRTVPVRLDGRYNSFPTHVAVAVDEQSWTASPDRVTVNVELVEQSESRQIEQAVVHMLRGSGDLRLMTVVPERVAIMLKGNAQRVETLEAQDMFVYVDCSALTDPGSYDLPVRVDSPEGVQVDQVAPSMVKVTVKTM
ncbi:MAG: CdaR family protein [Kiritimatiellaceae bacterium]|nr:CdaR family protein [Kiritimatiellaceae bacterium]